MSKAHRGTGIRKLPNHGRGTCPVCGRQQIKLLYDQEVNGEKIKVCKICNGNFKNKARKAERDAKKVAPIEAAPAADGEAPAAAAE